MREHSSQEGLIRANNNKSLEKFDLFDRPLKSLAPSNHLQIKNQQSFNETLL
jgi:hypothetical protein